MNKWPWRLMLVLALASGLISCSSGETSGTAAPPLRIAYSSRWGDYTMIVAQEAGFFSKFGVEVEPVYYNTAFHALVDMAADHLDGSLMGLGDMMNVDTHVPIRVVAASDSGGSGAVVASHLITEVADLKGRRIGVELGTSGELFVLHMLESAGLTMSDVTLVNVHPEEMASAIGNRVDAGFTWEPHASRAVARGNRLLYDPDQEASLFPTVIAFQQTALDSRPADIRLFLQAWFAAVEFRRQNPDQANQLIAAHFDLQAPELIVDPQVHILDANENPAYFLKARPATGQTLFTAGQINAEFLMRIGVLTRLPNLDGLLDASYLH